MRNLSYELERAFEMKSTTKVESLAWLQTRKKILQLIKKRVAEHILKESAELRAYRREYELGFHQKIKPITIDELLKELQNARIIFGGDFHAFPQAQRTHLKILRRFEKHEQLILAFEATDVTQNAIVASFLDDKISEKIFFKEAD